MQYASNACTIRVYFRIIRFVPVESYLYGTGTAAQLHRLSFGKETLQPMTEDNRKESGCTHTTAMQGHTLRPVLLFGVCFHNRVFLPLGLNGEHTLD